MKYSIGAAKNEASIMQASIRKSRSSSPSSHSRDTNPPRGVTAPPRASGDPGSSNMVRLITIRSMTRSFIPSLPPSLPPSRSFPFRYRREGCSHVGDGLIVADPRHADHPHDRRYYYRPGDHRWILVLVVLAIKPLSRPLSPLSPLSPSANRVQPCGTVTVICRCSAPYDRPFSNRFRMRDI